MVKPGSQRSQEYRDRKSILKLAKRLMRDPAYRKLLFDTIESIEPTRTNQARRTLQLAREFDQALFAVAREKINNLH
jgi:hypothetical protein